jgi:undecaprenyl diphosphate synthase
MSLDMPRHIAIIMDGNGRWAKNRGLPRFMGHKAGVNSLKSTVRYCSDHGVEVLSVFAFSSENWQRPKTEVLKLMGLFLLSLKKEIKALHKKNVRLRFIGDLTQLDENLQKVINDSYELTKDNAGLTLVVAFNYGGQWDVCQAAKCLAQQVANGDKTQEEFTPENIAAHLSSSDLPDPDLFIRTSGEKRISNFFLWQLAYSELYFCEEHWPDFKEPQLEAAINAFRSRDRRFGKVKEGENK